MHLFLGENPRALYLITGHQDEVQGRPSRALVFRAAEGKSSQAIVEFLPKSEVDITGLVKLSNRIIKGCLGLISFGGGTSILVRIALLLTCPTRVSFRCISCRDHVGDGGRKHTAIWW